MENENAELSEVCECERVYREGKGRREMCIAIAFL
jgi:hypothetical protein